MPRKCCVALSALVSALFLWSAIAQAEGITVGSRAEWLDAKTLLMHTPGQELFLGVVHPAAALFEKPFSIDRAAAEHRNYIMGDAATSVTLRPCPGAAVAPRAPRVLA